MAQEVEPHLTRTSCVQVEMTWPGQERWLRDYCASGLYILTLLVQGYGFTEETWSSIEFRKQVLPPGLERCGALGGWSQP